MLVGVFSIEGTEDSSEADEKLWNDWVAELAGMGLEPEGEPLDIGPLTGAFRLRRIDQDERVADERAIA